MVITNASLRGKPDLVDIFVENGTFSQIAPAGTVPHSDQTVMDAKEHLVIPPFVEPHIHLDFALTAGIPHHNMSGTLFEGIQIWSDHKIQFPLDKEEIKEKVRKAIRMQLSYGVQVIRSHVDTTDEKLLALETMLEIKEEFRDIVELQLVAFPQEGIYAYPNGDVLIEEAVRMGADCVGGIPHFEYCRENGVRSVEKTIELACKYDRLVDVHCDETDDDQSRFLEVLAARAYENGIGSKVTASHTVAMHSYNNAYCSKLFNILKKSGIHFAVCPPENTHLQGRGDSYPKRRGVTRVKELTEAGINVAFGQDSISDPWYPLGTGNLLRVLDFGLHVCQLTGYDEICRSLDFITSHGAKLLNIEDHYGIEEGKPANFIILNAKSDFEAVQFLREVLLSVRNGKVLMERTPSIATLKI